MDHMDLVHHSVRDMKAVFANCVRSYTAPPFSRPAAGWKATLRDVQKGSCAFVTLAHITVHCACADPHEHDCSIHDKLNAHNNYYLRCNEAAEAGHGVYCPTACSGESELAITFFAMCTSSFISALPWPIRIGSAAIATICMTLSTRGEAVLRCCFEAVLSCGFMILTE